MVAYLRDGRLLEERDEVRKLRIRLAKYVFIDEVLYKKALPKVFSSRRSELRIKRSS